MSIERIHPVLITRDAAPTIGKALESLREFPSVLVYDNGSADDTIAICERFANVRVETGPFEGFGATKSRAVGLAAGDWVLSIDADEYLSPDLLASLRAANLEDGVAYAIERFNVFMGRRVRHGGWGDDWLVRLFDRRRSGFDDSPVHEKVSVPEGVRVERLEGALWHVAVTDIDQFLGKISRYSELEIERSRHTHHPAVIAVHATWAVFRSYVLKLGFLEGWRGLVIAYCDGVGCFFKHMKRWVARNVPEAERSRSPR